MREKISLILVMLLIFVSFQYFKIHELLFLIEKARSVENSHPVYEFKERGAGWHWEVTYNVGNPNKQSNHARGKKVG